MRSSTYTLLLGGFLTSAVLAAPSQKKAGPTQRSEQSKPRSFTIPVIRERSSLARRADGAVATYDLGGPYAFKSPVLVGGQQMMLQIDTGSADL